MEKIASHLIHTVPWPRPPTRQMFRTAVWPDTGADQRQHGAAGEL
jgi:hypothetical protein